MLWLSSLTRMSFRSADVSEWLPGWTQRSPSALTDQTGSVSLAAQQSAAVVAPPLGACASCSMTFVSTVKWCLPSSIVYQIDG